MSADFGEVFSAEVPTPRHLKDKQPPPDVEAKARRKYTRKQVLEKVSEPVVDNVSDDVMEVVERLFEDTQVANYHMVKSFIELCEIVAPENHRKLAMILEGLISK